MVSRHAARIHHGVMRAVREPQLAGEKQIPAVISTVTRIGTSLRGGKACRTSTEVIGCSASTIDAMLVARMCRRPPMRRVKERLARRLPGAVVMSYSLRW